MGLDNAEPTEIDDLIDHARMATLDGALLEVFWLSVCEPAKFRDRVVDRRTITGFDVLREVSLSYGPFVGEGPHRIAFLRPVKNRTIPGLRIRSASGRSLMVMSQHHVKHDVVLALNSKLREAFPGVSEAARESILRTLIEVILDTKVGSLARAGIDEKERAIHEQVAHDLQRRTGASRVETPLLEQIAAFSACAAVRDLLVVDLPADESGTLEYEMHEFVITVVREKPGFWDAISLAVGAIPRRCTITLYKASTCREYQLEFRVGRGNYISSIEVQPDCVARQVGTGTEMGVVTGVQTCSRGDVVEMQVKEHPNKTLLLAGLLSIVTTTAAIAVAVLGDRLGGTGTGQISLSAALGTLGGLAVIAGMIWTVAGRGLEGRTLCPGAMSSTVASALTFMALLLLVLTGVSAKASWFLATFSILASLGVLLHFVLTVRELASLRRKSGLQHPETPRTS